MKFISALKRWRPLQLSGLLMVLLVVGFSLLYPLSPGYDPYTQNLSSILQSPGSSGHWLGTDSLGRDVASRLALGGRTTLSIALAVILANMVIGIIIGMVAGYFGGRTDNVLMGLTDVQLALPVMLVLIAFSAVYGPSVTLMIVVLSVTYWVGYARVARSVALSLAGRDFVLAPKIQGAGPLWIMRRHIAPNVFTQVLIVATTDLGAIIILIASFDFLGLGIQAPTPSWGSMISDGQGYLRQQPALVMIPGVAMFLIIAGTNLISQRFTEEGAGAPARRKVAA
ncbi:ABC transporter permease [Nesterenkonia alkaliphila]|uniref:ABC transporter permease subunit n=1 Tax=Nesterenkonia alkaliphila TaxID=1463631 RepID=A0A7K1UJN9_9MICC|nr:ABC transporter permease [Nesterenkonia alkaliphila]MVT26708.1 ABC transporter permease subunit [Nesterenkonia alkaliphila]GFZ76889.1 peptide ABC transporter permease [Nesterenkonia alkaliphila]